MNNTFTQMIISILHFLQINVILVSSDHVFPFRLADPKLGFKLEDMNRFIFAGEVPPDEMFELECALVDRILIA